MTTSPDPRVVAAAKAWDKHMGGRYAPDEVEELSEEVAVILAAADAVDPLRDRKGLITRMAAGISKSHGTTEPIVHIDDEGAICYRLPALADVILTEDAA